jgi:lipopolysaccharide transport system permease protein
MMAFSMRTRSVEFQHSSATSAGSWSPSDRWLHRRDLLRELIGRDMRLRYRGSLFGMAWTLLNPITELLVLLFVFGTVLPLGIPNYAAFLFTGLLVYTWFQSSLSYATAAIVNNRDLIRRPDVPLSVLPIVSVASTLLHFVMSLPVLFVLLVTSGVHLTIAALALPVLMGVQFVLILALAYPLSAIHVWFRDTQYFLGLALQLLFFMTPVFYEPKTIPERFQYLYRLNPMVGIVDGYRDVLIRGVFPPLDSWVILAVVSTALLFLGLNMFKRASHRFVDEL